MTTTPITTTTSDAAWSPDQYFFAPSDAIPQALVLTATTKGGNVEGDAPAVRVAVISDDDAQVVLEGAEIPDAAPTLAEKLVYTSKVAQDVPISREQWVQPQTATQISESVSRAITKEADRLFLLADDPSPEVAPSIGLMNHPDIVEGGTVSGNLDELTDLVATLQANDAEPSMIVMGPRMWAEFKKLKIGTDYNSTLLGAGTTDAEQLVESLPVIVNNRLAMSFEGLVIDKRAIVSATGPVRIANSEHVLFRHDSVLVRATFRFGTVVVRPERIGKFSIVQPGS